jgi:hypothetical protein
MELCDIFSIIIYIHNTQHHHHTHTKHTNTTQKPFHFITTYSS